MREPMVSLAMVVTPIPRFHHPGRWPRWRHRPSIAAHLAADGERCLPACPNGAQRPSCTIQAKQPRLEFKGARRQARDVEVKEADPNLAAQGWGAGRIAPS